MCENKPLHMHVSTVVCVCCMVINSSAVDDNHVLKIYVGIKICAASRIIRLRIKLLKQQDARDS